MCTLHKYRNETSQMFRRKKIALSCLPVNQTWLNCKVSQWQKKVIKWERSCNKPVSQVWENTGNKPQWVRFRKIRATSQWVEFRGGKYRQQASESGLIRKIRATSQGVEFRKIKEAVFIPQICNSVWVHVVMLTQPRQGKPPTRHTIKRHV